MGVDNDAVLIYGWSFSCEEFFNYFFNKTKELGIFDESELFDIKNIKSYEDIEENNLEYEIFDIFKEWASKNYGYCIDYCNPYFDCGSSEAIYYISYSNINDNLYELVTANENFKSTEFLEWFDITDNYKPTMDALPNIW